jgi:2-oxoisovalerate dehydrogenase E1 component alpha subunit
VQHGGQVRKAPCVFFLPQQRLGHLDPALGPDHHRPHLAQKAVAYGMPAVLVDGNDVLALAFTSPPRPRRARAGARGPTLIEALTYRRGAHTSSDDPTVYRDPSRATRVGMPRSHPALPRLP